MAQGILFVISGPSGVGKGTVCSKLRANNPTLRYSISATTRLPRPGEKDGLNYYFTTREHFKQMIATDSFIEFAWVYGNYYGTPKEKVVECLEAGYDILLEIDIQGALQVKEKFPDGVFIFIMPPSLAELKKRIINRGSESPESLTQRLGSVHSELQHIYEYDYLVINDVLDRCVVNIETVILAEKSKVKRNDGLIERLLNREE